MKKKLIIVILFSNLLFNSFAANYYYIFKQNTAINPIDSNSLFLEFKSNAFFKNNEYFGDFIKGYTIPGYSISPSITYFAGIKTKISFGLYLQTFAGADKNSILPTFKIHHKLNSNIDLVMGELYGCFNHNLIEAMYDYDRYFFNRIEEGLQFLFNYEKYKSDVWINWENFIDFGDPFQERFTFGTTNNYKLVKKESLITEILFQSLISHRGGQINSIDTTIQNLANINPGIKINYKMGKSTISIFSFFPMSSDFSPEPESKYLTGIASMPGLEFTIKGLYVSSYYWYSNRFIGHRGNPVFSSVSSITPQYGEKHRELAVLNVGYSSNFKSGISLGVGTQLYYDIINSKPEYNYSLFLVFNRDFFMKRY